MVPTSYAKFGAKQSFKREIGAVCLLGVFLFISCALYSYNPEDLSLIHYTTRTLDMVYNWCGVVGAHSAAILVYLFGSAAFLVSGLLAFCLYLIIARRSFGYEWERLVAGVGCMITAATFCAMYQIDFLRSPAPGGAIGVACLRVLHYFFDRVGGALCLFVLFYISFILAFRFSFMACARACMRVYNFIRVNRIIERVGAVLYGAGKTVGMYLAIPAKKIYSVVRSILDGSIFTGTVFMVPDFDYIKEYGPELDGHEYPEYAQNSEIGMRTQGQFGESGAHNLGENNAGENGLRNFGALNGSSANSRASGSAGAGVRDGGGVNSAHNHAQEHGWGENSKRDSSVGFGNRIAGLAGNAPSKNNKETAGSQKPSYMLPDLSYFVGVAHEKNNSVLKQELEERAQLLQDKLERFGIKGSVTAIKRGPVVTLFEYEPHIDAKLSRILALEDDLAMALKAHSIRILAPIPGRSVVGFEVANAERTDVLLADTIHSAAYKKSKALLPLILGQDTSGETVIVDLVRMPHFLVAGSTGSGKSVGLNAMLMSLLCSRTPDEMKLILIDPKRLEFTAYEDIAHLLFPIITDTKQAVPVLKWVAMQMDERYERMAQSGARNIVDYHNQCKADSSLPPMPFMVIIIDELADLMMTVGHEVETVIARITQMARAAGIHLIVATQRPSVDVITGCIKVNFPSRVSFRVTSRVDSRTILDCSGADKLLGRGDMLFLDSTTSSLRRVHGAYVSDKEIEQITNHIRAERAPEYLDIVQELQKELVPLDEKEDYLFQQILSFVHEVDEISISLLQRKFKIGYNRSARIIEMLESRGLIMPADGSKMRRVIK
jgi:hypothetical protein